MRYKSIKKIPFCLPWGKADDPPSFSLSRARSKRLRLRPWCLKFGASSTFAHLGCQIGMHYSNSLSISSNFPFNIWQMMWLNHKNLELYLMTISKKTIYKVIFFIQTHQYHVFFKKHLDMSQCGIYYWISQILFGSVHKKAVTAINWTAVLPLVSPPGAFFW